MEKIVKETVRTVLFELCKKEKSACPLINEIDSMKEEDVWDKLRELLSCKTDSECDKKFRKLKEKFAKSMEELGFKLT